MTSSTEGDEGLGFGDMIPVIKEQVLCLSGQEMAPTGQKPLLKDAWCQDSILWAEQLADPTIAYITSIVKLLTTKVFISLTLISVNVMQSSVLTSK